MHERIRAQRKAAAQARVSKAAQAVAEKLNVPVELAKLEVRNSDPQLEALFRLEATADLLEAIIDSQGKSETPVETESPIEDSLKGVVVPLPTAYSEETLAQFMHTKLAVVATAMNYTAPSGDAGVYAEAVNDVLIAYGVNDIANATDVPKLRALAEREAWRKVMNESVGHYDVTADEQSFKRSQLHEQAKASFEIADAEAKKFSDEDDGYAAEIIGIVKPTTSTSE